MPHHPHDDIDSDVWSVEGQFKHLVFSPNGGIEGLMITTNGIDTQFTNDPHDMEAVAALLGLQEDQDLVVEGRKARPSREGESDHVVYRFERLASIDGQAPPPPKQEAKTEGRVQHFNFAKHGVPNGVVLDNGDFVHSKPGAIASLQLQIGDSIRAEGPAQPLATGKGLAIEASQVNDHTL